MKVRCYNIQWETDGKKVKLPKSMTFDVEVDDFDDLKDVLSDCLSDTTGWLHNGFSYKIIPVTQRQYVKEGFSRCPFCGKDDGINGESMEVDANVASQEVSCSFCGAAWIDNYRLVGFTAL